MASSWANLLHTDLTGRRVKLFPELARFGDAKRQNQAFNAARKAARQKLPIVLRYAHLLYFAAIVARGYGRFSIWIVFLFLVAIQIATERWLRKPIRFELHRRLNAGFNCQLCDYLLLGNLSGCCSECGSPISEESRRLILNQGQLGLEIDTSFGVEYEPDT